MYLRFFDVAQGCPTRSPLEVLMRPSDDFQFSGYNKGYEEEFREIAKRHFGRKSIYKRRFWEKTFVFRKDLNFGTKLKKSEQKNR